MKNIMTRAWEMYKSAGCTTKAEFAVALKMAWAEAKSPEWMTICEAYKLRINAQGKISTSTSASPTQTEMAILKANSDAAKAYLFGKASISIRIAAGLEKVETGERVSKELLNWAGGKCHGAYYAEGFYNEVFTPGKGMSLRAA